MRWFLMLLAPLMLTVVSPVMLSAEDYPVLTEDQLNSYYVKLYEALSKAEEKVQKLQAIASDPSHAPVWSDKLELQQALVQLEVKRTLFNNFKGTESLRSAAVRDKLVQVLNNQDIKESDLADLQSLVLQEKAKIRAASGNAAPAPAPVPATAQ